MIAIGGDVHKRPCTVAMQREGGELKCFGPMENTREGWRALLEQLPPPTALYQRVKREVSHRLQGRGQLGFGS